MSIASRKGRVPSSWRKPTIRGSSAGLGVSPSRLCPILSMMLSTGSSISSTASWWARSHPWASSPIPASPGSLPEDCEIHVLSHRDENGNEALAKVATALGVERKQPRHIVAGSPRPVPQGRLTGEAIGASLANRLPPQAIIWDEALTAGDPIQAALRNATPYSQLQITGGSIGIGLPLAIGAAIACPERKVVLLQADGSGMYTNQALWTHAREKLNIVTIVLSNRSYAILRHELRNVGVLNPGPKALAMTSLSDPDIDWPSLARGMGVSGDVAKTAERFDELLAQAMERSGPYLIEADLAV
jgi:acetolactate synthase-1/2/3 large subunit